MTNDKSFVFIFAAFEVREREYCLIKAGEVLAVEPTVFRVLLFLLHNPRKLVTKEELLNAVWGDAAVTENSLTRSILKLRRALGDDAREPRYIETVSTVGYRFICAVETKDFAKASSQVAEEVPISHLTQETQKASMPASIETNSRSWPRRRRWPWVAAAAVLAVSGIAVGWWEWWSTPAVPYVTSIEAITHDGVGKDWLVTDGSRVYFSDFVQQRRPLAQVSVTGGESSILATPFAWNAPLDIAPDKSSLLVSENRWNESSPLWIVPLPSGAPRRVGNLLTDCTAAWTPDGTEIVFSKGKEIWKANADGSQAHKVLTIPGLACLLRFSPDGERMRFTVNEQLGASTLWEAKTDGSGAHRLLQGWQEQPTQGAGSWTPNGRYYVFSADTQNRTDLWILADRRKWFFHQRSVPVQLTRGPLFFGPLVAFSTDGRTLFAPGGEQHMELMRFDPAKHQAAPYLSGVSATDVAFSADGQWVTYVTVPDRSLWRSKTDGSDRLQLSSPPGYVAIPRWSPDGGRIAFIWIAPGKQVKLAMISRDGGAPEQVIPDSEDSHEQEDPTWSPDGEQIIFARDPGLDLMERVELLRVDLRTRKVTPIPGSEGLYSPRWSPDGRYLAAFSHDSRSIRLFDFQKQVWTIWFTAAEGHVGWNLWSQDSKDLYFGTDKADLFAYWRIGVGDQSPMKIADLTDEHTNVSLCPILAPDGGLLYTRDLSTREIYAIHLSGK